MPNKLINRNRNMHGFGEPETSRMANPNKKSKINLLNQTTYHFLHA